MRNRRGLTLAEVLVVMTLLAVTVGLTVAAYVQSLAVQRKAETRSDAYRALAVTMAHLDQSLRGVRIDLAAPGRLQFRVPKTDDGRLQIDASGSPVFGDIVVVELLPDGNLQQSTLGAPEKTRLISRLGQDSTIDFTLNPDQILTITMSLYGADEAGGRRIATRRVFVGNQN